MAIVRATDLLDLIRPAVFGGAVEAATGSLFSRDDDGLVVSFQGTGFTFSGGSVSGGRVTAFSITEGGETLIRATGLSTPITAEMARGLADGQLRPFVDLALAGDDDIRGSAFDDQIAGYAGNDSLFGGAGRNYINGGGGLDTAVYDAPRLEHSIEETSLGWRVASFDRSIDDQLVDIERMAFGDSTIAFDETAAYGYRLYRAAFDREPDRAGLSFWVNEIDNGMTLFRVAAGFIDSNEFRTLYNTDLPDKSFLYILYENVLDRESDQAGYDFWLGEMDRGMTRAEVLTRFSDSVENRQNVAVEIERGIVLDPI